MSVASHLGIRLADYDQRVRTFIPHYEEMLEAAARSAGYAAPRSAPIIVDLGIGTGALSARCLERLPAARVVGIDADAGMLEVCGRRLRDRRTVQLVHADFSRVRIPPCDLVVATLALHHLRTSGRKRVFYRRCFEALCPSGALVSGDCCPSTAPRLAAAEREAWSAHLRHSYTSAKTKEYFAAWAAEDRYFPLMQELRMLSDAGFEADVVWRRAPFAVIVARKPIGGRRRSRDEASPSQHSARSGNSAGSRWRARAAR